MAQSSSRWGGGSLLGSLLKALRPGEGAGRAGRLAAAAGRAAGPGGPFLEALEERKLLATIGPGDLLPGSDIGVRVVHFGYAVPFLFQELPDEVAAPVVIEGFGDEQAFWTQFVPPIPPSGTFFDQSEIQISYPGVGATPILILGPNPAGPGVPAAPQDQDLAIQLDQNGFVTFTFFEGVQAGNPAPRLAQSVALDVRGLDTSATGTKVELLRNNQPVATFSGAALAALGAPVFTGNTRYTLNFVQGFDAVRFSSAEPAPDNADYSDNFTLEQIAVTFPSERFVQSIESRLFGVRYVLVGPVGTSADFFDLYGRPMVETVSVGVPEGRSLPIIDPNGDGVPDFNDGIGRVVLSNTEDRAHLFMWGGTITATDDPDEDDDFFDGQFAFRFPDGVAGIFDEFEGAGFGYALTNTAPPDVIGLPPGSGSIVFGSPIVRDNTSTQSYYAAFPPARLLQQPQLFRNADQGVFVTGGRNMGVVHVDGVLHGSSHLTGSVHRFSTGVLLGSLRIDGDAGGVIVASDAGHWVRDDVGTSPPIARDPDTLNDVGNELVVGRSAREIAIGGRSTMEITVLGDISSPVRSPMAFLDYTEREFVTPVNPANEETDTIAAVLGGLAGTGDARFTAIPFGLEWYRNNTISAPEFIGGPTTAVRVLGIAGQEDPVASDEDPVDVYAFAAGRGQTVVVDVIFHVETLGFNPERGFNTLGLARIVDVDGRVVASHEVPTESQDQLPLLAPSVRFTFTPERTDVFYLVINTPVDPPDADQPLSYQATVSGMLATALGQYRSGGSTGLVGNPTAITVSSGSVGSFMVGTGWVGGDGGENPPNPLVNSSDDANDLMSFRESTLSVAGNAYSLWFGSDVFGLRAAGGGVNTPGPQVFIGGFLGAMRTGMSPLVGGSTAQGDVRDLQLQIGGGAGIIDVRGALRFDQDYDRAIDASRAVNITTGTTGAPGHIGLFNVGAFMDGRNFTLRTSNNSTIDRFLVGEDPGGTGEIDERNPRIIMGTGSDIRFASFTTIETGLEADAFIFFAPGAPLLLTDDSGGVVRIAIEGGGSGATTSTGQVRVLPVDGSQGVTIARIDVNLVGAGNLVIERLSGPGVVSIGSLLVTTSAQPTGTPGPARPGVVLRGGGEIDIWKIEHRIDDGLELGIIENSTPGGDIVAIDAETATFIRLGTGDLGRTQVNPVGPTRIGPFLGISAGQDGDVDGTLGLDEEALNEGWNGDIFIPLPQRTVAHPGDVFLEDIGSPLDPYLNGVVIRTGDVTEVVGAGAIGDVILQGGSVTRVIANSDGLTPFGRFEGIIGTVYADDIGSVDVGDGLAAPGDGPFALAGVFANDDIGLVFGGRGLNPVIRGVVAAANLNVFEPGQGVGDVGVERGRIDGAFIGSATLDSWWLSARFRPSVTELDADDEIATGNIANVTTLVGDIFRSHIFGINIARVEAAGGAYDATRTEATGSIASVLADEFRNTTRLGEPLEVRRNEILANNDVSLVSTRDIAVGDMSDLLIDVGGSLLTGARARNLSRVRLEVDGRTNQVFATSDIRATSINTGTLVSAEALGDIRSSTITVAGQIVQVVAGDNITSTVISSTGPNGQIDLVRSRLFLTGTISSSGPIGTIHSTSGDVIATVRTTDADGSLDLLQAGGSLIVSTDIAGNVNRVIAGRNVGEPFESRGARAINVEGSLGLIEAQGGQIYTDVRVGQTLGTVRVARVVALPGNDLVAHANYTAFGRIELVDIRGDFAGSIVSESGGIGTVQILDGSFRPGNAIIARDGGIDQVVITGGHLLGDVLSDEHIGALRILPNDIGFWGDIGVNPNLSQFAPFDGLRNQLPPGVEPIAIFQGPRIQAGTNIGLVEVARASIWKGSIYAGWSVGRLFVFGVMMNDNITPGLGGSWVAAGDSIGSVEVLQFAGGAWFLAGLTALGADNRPGGVGADADTVHFGRVGDLVFRGGTGAVTVSAGMNAGPDGVYNTIDDEVADGLSSIGSVRVEGLALETTAFADNGIGPTSPGIVRGGPGRNQRNPGRIIEFVPSVGALPNGVPTPFTTPAGETGRITFTGRGQAFYENLFDPEHGRTIGRLAIINSTFGDRLVVDTDQNSLTDFVVKSNDGSSLSFASIRGNLIGISSFYFDAYVEFAEFGALNTAGVVGAGNDIGVLVVGPTTRGLIDANYINRTVVGGDFGTRGGTTAATMDLLAAGSILIGGNHLGVVTLERDVAGLRVEGGMDRGAVRSGRSLTSVDVGFMDQSRITARNDILDVLVRGDMRDSLIYAGADLGRDGLFGGVGEDTDVVTDGRIDSVRVLGSFVRSDIAAGVARGPDAFVGTPDDRVDAGRSAIGAVTIQGQVAGSNLASQSYRIVSTGTVGSVTVAGQPFTATGNLAVVNLDPTALPLQVTGLRVEEEARQYIAVIGFNQPIDASTLGPALTISELRAGSAVQIRLAEGSDYTLGYNPGTSEVRVTFARAITDRSLPELPGLPGPGVYRFELDAAILRGETQRTLLDGDKDGFAEGAGDDFSQDEVVGDAGDKLTPNTVTIGTVAVDFRGPIDLDLVLDDNHAPDDLPDPNRVYTVRGVAGDHPDHDLNVFPFAGDADLYKITLRAGQILRLGKMGGNAVEVGRALLDAAGNIMLSRTGVAPAGNETVQALRLPNAPRQAEEITVADEYLIKVTGTYYLLVTPLVTAVTVSDPTQVPVLTPIAGAQGSYVFTLEVFDDGDTGFTADNGSGDGMTVVNAPVPIEFAGADQVFGTPDDRPVVQVGVYNFTLFAGGDGVPNTFDDVVSGSSGTGITSQRTSGPNGVFGDADDRAVSFVGASIGKAASAGVPEEVAPDIDVYHLNNREAIAPGTRIRVTLRLTEFGSNIGLSPNARQQDLRGDVQFAIFETSGSTDIADGLLVAAPSDVLPIGGQPTRITSNGNMAYGYDANGDFTFEFVTPGRLGVAGQPPATYALYIQGAIRSDYELEILTQGTGLTAPVTQNVFIETRGGSIDWLEAGRGVVTTLNPFSTGVVGFGGFVGAQTVDDYVVSRVISNLNAIFAGSNANIVVANTTAAFEQGGGIAPFSTVFLTSSNEPTAFFANRTYGASQHSDPFNIDLQDQAVVFAPQLALFGQPPSVAGINAFADQLSDAVARRIGELVGLRLTGVAPPVQFVPVMAANSPEIQAPGVTYTFINGARVLSTHYDIIADTDFYLGLQNSVALLNRIIAPR
ncbi:MAG TPA: hypothetical protein VD963_03395 [Phycisphaerales bacterium]|nr:hypothetical protein [Phycisphaerales bacterium]